MLIGCSFTHRQPDDFIEEDLFVGKEVKHKILVKRREGDNFRLRHR